MNLPRALAPWGSVLRMFPPELAAALGDLVARLAVLVGPLARETSATQGEPDGVAGIGRRGAFDRLLATDWALLHEVPDEFLRRAAQRELSFFEIARIEPSRDRRCVALFDAGGPQLGGPRLVQLAMLVLLAQRAKDAGASFSWGMLQSDDLIDGLSKASVGRLLRARRREPAGEGELARWRERLRAPASEERDLWILGGRRTPDPAPGPHARVEIEDPLDPARGGALEVTVRVAKRPDRSAVVDLPPGPIAVRLLRNPFDGDRGAGAVRQDLGRIVLPWTFDRSGARTMLVRDDTGSVLVLRLTQPAPVRAYQPAAGETVLGFGLGKKGRASVLLARSDGHWFGTLGKRAHLAGPLLAVVVPEDIARIERSTLFPQTPADSFAYEGSWLTRLHHPPGAAKHASHVVVPAFAVSGEYASVLAVTAEKDARLIRCTLDADGAVQSITLGEMPDMKRGARVFFGDGRIGYELDPGLFSLRPFDRAGGGVVRLEQGEEPIGVLGLDPDLVVLDASRRLVRRIRGSNGERSTMFEVPTPVHGAEVAGDFLVALHEDHRLETRRLSSGAVTSRYDFRGLA